MLASGTVSAVAVKLRSSVISFSRSSIFFLLAVGLAWQQWHPRFVPLQALLCYGTLEAVFWTCRLLLAFASRFLFRRPSLDLRWTPAHTLRVLILGLIGLCGLFVIPAYIRFRQYLGMPMEDLFIDDYKRTDFFDWMCNGDYAIDAVLPFALMMLLVMAYGAVELLLLWASAFGLLATASNPASETKVYD